VSSASISAGSEAATADPLAIARIKACSSVIPVSDPGPARRIPGGDLGLRRVRHPRRARLAAAFHRPQAVSLSRRQLLSVLALGLGAMTLKPGRVLALGGTLPALDAAAPDFSLDGVAPGPAGADGSSQARPVHLSLADFRGRWLVLYFYPRDFTSGCTLEARGFQRALADFQATGAAVVGISADGPEDYAAFCSSEGLAYPLLSDPGGAVSRRYGSWLAPFSQRHSFLIDPDGVLRAVWTAVRPAGHAQEVLTELRELQQASA
jgi:thioredoxin-dependent peroxiredoxin